MEAAGHHVTAAAALTRVPASVRAVRSGAGAEVCSFSSRGVTAPAAQAAALTALDSSPMIWKHRDRVWQHREEEEEEIQNS